MWQELVKVWKVEIRDDSNLEIIGEGAFSSTEIESIKIAIHIQQIHEATLSDCDFSEDSDLQTIELKLKAWRFLPMFLSSREDGAVELLQKK